jgi:hypothetical protein
LLAAILKIAYDNPFFGAKQNSNSVRLSVVAALHINENLLCGRPQITKSRDLETSSRDLKL